MPQALAQTASEKQDKYVAGDDKDLASRDAPESRPLVRERIFSKGQSRRIWGELYKVIDSSDVVIQVCDRNTKYSDLNLHLDHVLNDSHLQVLDARDPMGTRSSHIESYMKREKAYKHLVFVLNKCDLVPTWVAVRLCSALYILFLMIRSTIL